MPRGVLAAAVAATLAGVLCACTTSSGGDKTGNRTVVLTLASIDNINPNGQQPASAAFVRELLAVSHGAMKVQVHDEFESGAPAAETDLVKAVGAGSFDLGIPATRAFAAAGIPSLRALEAPMVITSRAAEDAVVNGPAGAHLLASLDSSDVVGLALFAGPLRRPMATTPLLGPTTWHGKRFRSFNSPIQDATVKALRGTPVHASFGFPSMVRAGTLDGAELDIAQYQENTYAGLLPAVTGNVVLWPRVVALTMNRKRYESLTAQQRQWLSEAAAGGVKAGTDFAYDESTPAAAMCRAGVRFYSATPAQVLSLTSAVAPVLNSLRSDPATGASLAEIEKVVAQHTGVDVPAVPASCLKPLSGP